MSSLWRGLPSPIAKVVPAPTIASSIILFYFLHYGSPTAGLGCLVFFMYTANSSGERHLSYNHNGEGLLSAYCLPGTANSPL